MSNNLRQAKKDLKAFAKRAKDVKYTESLLFSYLITGMITFSIGLNTSSNVLYERLNKELVMSADKTRTAIKKKKKANEEAIEDLNLELIQLMEQGDQVVKSPWQSWQFGANTFISSNNGTYKGRGDKAEKYSFNSIYNRGNWADTGILSNRRKSYMTSSLSTSTIGKQSYGLASLLHVQEPEVEIQIMANVRPKSVFKEEIAINPKIDMPREVVRPNINLKVTEPITAPNITFPNVKPINIDIKNPVAPSEPKAIGAPNINITLGAPEVTLGITPPSTPNINISVTPPVIKPLTIAKPSEVELPTINAPVISPIKFSIDPTGNARYKDGGWKDWATGGKTTHNITGLGNKDYITLSAGHITGANVEDKYTFNVTVDNNRAFVLDEAADKQIFTNKATINLQGSRNVAIDIQGTHGSGISGTMNGRELTAINAGTITGEKGNGNENQVAFGFNNPDASDNKTLTKMINKGTITLKADKSAAFQLKPEDPHNWDPDKSGGTGWYKAPIKVGGSTPINNRGKVAMQAINKGEVNIDGDSSFGITTVFNEGLPIEFLAEDKRYLYENLKSQRQIANQIVNPGGEFGNSNISGFESGVYNESTGTININGENSIAIGLLHDIQEAKIAGKININSNKGVGVFTGVPVGLPTATTPDFVKLKGEININNTAVNAVGTYVGDTSVDLNDGKVNGTVTTGRKYLRSGDVEAESTSIITVKGTTNYGFVVNNSSNYSKFSGALDDMQQGIDKTNHGRGINDGKIYVEGEKSVGFALIKGGDSSNSGTISVKPSSEESVGFYGEQDKFDNSGTIEVTTTGKKKNIGVALNGKNNNQIQVMLI